MRVLTSKPTINALILYKRVKKSYSDFMQENQDWQEKTYKDVFEEEMRGLERRKNHDSSCTISHIQGILSHLYIRDGQNWEGRGAYADIVSSATIAAYEAFIENWKQCEK